MNSWWPAGVLIAIVVAIVSASRHPSAQRIFHWLPIPLWCYAIPMVAVAVGWLPAEHAEHPLYRHLTDRLLPFALGVLLLGVDLPSIMQAGGRALLAAAIGAVGIIVGAPLGVWLLQNRLPPEAWKGAAALAGTWTGGTMNLLSLRMILQIPDVVFAPLIVVDAMIAYGWMACLIAASGFEQPINRWLRVTTTPHVRDAHVSAEDQSTTPLRLLSACAALSLGLVIGARALAARLPTSQLITSTNGWTVLLITTIALGLSLIPTVRRIGATGSRLGYPCLYLVLAATGAQASLNALWSAPMWLILGLIIVIVHGLALLVAGRWLRLPLGMLATASQANIGGVVSAPLVGAVYDQSLAPIGLLLAVAGNALGTYLGLWAATLCRWFLRI